MKVPMILIESVHFPPSSSAIVQPVQNIEESIFSFLCVYGTIQSHCLYHDQFFYLVSTVALRAQHLESM